MISDELRVVVNTFIDGHTNLASQSSKLGFVLTMGPNQVQQVKMYTYHILVYWLTFFVGLYNIQLVADYSYGSSQIWDESKFMHQQIQTSVHNKTSTMVLNGFLFVMLCYFTYLVGRKINPSNIQLRFIPPKCFRK